jgi:hypothetical protein
MKAAEILRKLADLIDSHSDEGQVERPVNTVPHAELEPVEVDNTEGGEASTMIPPLQAKLELLKKSVGVDNVYDREDCDCGCDPCECSPDELDTIKKHAGIPVIAQHEAAEDNDITG